MTRTLYILVLILMSASYPVHAQMTQDWDGDREKDYQYGGTDRDADNDGTWDYDKGGVDRDSDNDGDWDM